MELVGRQLVQRKAATQNRHKLDFDAVLVEQAVVERAVEMNKSSADRACGDAHRHGALAELSKIRIGTSIVALKAREQQQQDQTDFSNSLIRHATAAYNRCLTAVKPCIRQRKELDCDIPF